MSNKILSVELVDTDRRQRISGGVYIEFETFDNVKKNDYFRVIVDGHVYDFEASNIKVEGEKLRVTAKEVGYWAHKLDEKGVDLRSVIGCDVVLVTDTKEKSKIYERSCWC